MDHDKKIYWMIYFILNYMPMNYAVHLEAEGTKCKNNAHFCTFWRSTYSTVWWFSETEPGTLAVLS